MAGMTFLPDEFRVEQQDSVEVEGFCIFGLDTRCVYQVELRRGRSVFLSMTPSPLPLPLRAGGRRWRNNGL